MKTYCLPLLCLFTSMMVHAGKSYTLTATRGDIIISSLSTTPELVPGDTLFIPAEGRYTSVQYRRLKGDSLNKISVIWLAGSQVKAPSSFQQLSNFNVSFVIIENMLHYNFFGTNRFSYAVHDVEFRKCRWINPSGAYKDQPPVVWDDAYSPLSMVFRGKKSQTFYNIKYTGCLFDGFTNVNAIQLSSNWNDNTAEVRRSIAVDFEFAADTFQNIISVDSAPVGAISGTGFNCKVKQCVFRNIIGTGSHSASILWFGSIDVSQCLQENCYAMLLRCVPRGWSGLPGYYDKSTACRAWRNIIHNNLSFSAFEFNQDIGGGRNDFNSVHIVKASCLYNTVFRTHRANNGGQYYGFLADNINQDSLECSYNLIIAPECDFPFDVARDYIVAIIRSKPKHQVMTGNKVFRSWNRNVLTDTMQYQPGNAALLVTRSTAGYSFMSEDFDGKKLPLNGGAYAGAVEYTRLMAKKK